MTDDAKRQTLMFLLLTAIATVLFAAALPRLELKPGIPLPSLGDRTGTLPTEAEPPAVSISGNTYFKVILVVVLALVLAYCGYKFIKGCAWREIPGRALILTVLASVVLCILFALVNVRVTSEPLEPEVLPPVLPTDPPLGPLPANLIWLVWIGLAIVVVLLGIWISRRQTAQTRAGDPLKLEAERALQALRTGLDFKNVIVRCYRQMIVALQKEQEIELSETMTAREFERLLEARGLPYDPVHQLTQLFEAARYGLQPSDPTDEQRAFDCLNAIVRHSCEA